MTIETADRIGIKNESRVVLLSRHEVKKLITMREAMNAVENAFKLYSEAHLSKIGFPAE